MLLPRGCADSGIHTFRQHQRGTTLVCSVGNTGVLGTKGTDEQVAVILSLGTLCARSPTTVRRQKLISLAEGNA